MTTGIRDYTRSATMPYFRRGCVCYLHTFMIRSGLNVPTPAIPIPDLAVPYAAPSAATVSVIPYLSLLSVYSDVGWLPHTPKDHLQADCQRKQVIRRNGYGVYSLQRQCQPNTLSVNHIPSISDKTTTIEDTYKGEERSELRGVLAVRHDGPGGGREEIEENKKQSSERRIVEQQQQNKSSSNQST